MRNSKTFLFLFILFLSLSLVGVAEAGVSLRKATGGEALSGADVSGNWTSLSPIVVEEGVPGDIKLQDLILAVPDGFEFNAQSQPDVLTSGGTELLAHFGSITSSQIVVNITQVSATVPHTLTIGSTVPIQVRPTKNEALEGAIYMVSSSMEGVANGIDGDSFGDLAVVPVEEPEEEPEEVEEEVEEEEEEEEAKPIAEMTKEELLAKIEEIKAEIEELKAQLIQLLREKIAEITSEISELKAQLEGE